MDVDTAGPNTGIVKYEKHSQESIGAFIDWQVQTADRSEDEKNFEDSRFKQKPLVESPISINIQNQEESNHKEPSASQENGIEIKGDGDGDLDIDGDKMSQFVNIGIPQP